MTVNLLEYKKVKRSELIVKELEEVLNILRLTVKGLKSFRYYSPVKELLTQLHDTKSILEIHKNHHSNIIKNKENQ